MGDQGRLTLCNAIFDVPVLDYARPSRGLLIGSGSGIMMAVMDASDRFRFAVDLDQCRDHDALCDWVHALDRNGLVDLIAIAGWFSISSPKKIAGALSRVRVPAIVYVGAGLGREAFANCLVVDTLEEFLGRVAQAESTGPRHEGHGPAVAKHEPERPFEPAA